MCPLIEDVHEFGDILDCIYQQTVLLRLCASVGAHGTKTRLPPRPRYPFTLTCCGSAGDTIPPRPIPPLPHTWQQAPIKEWLPPKDGAAAGMPLESLYNTMSWKNCALLVGLGECHQRSRRIVGQG